ncbi:uncharacterized protein TRUGW13939_10226 [Talaromyces rugulosus]|uniref:Peptidase A1 domain-containing protein n=1 Tax=Talaromyces rugulosus TaxID=121627 RepID=A0A7H8RAP2_TALRU|nr:uncharacterized protein TRUGW13939_10226 [Talaromyces rugulosus]QKX63058.1 hypothetical protein TRUGW13939_10226 [Talaromyces rugulosus]
MTTSFENCKSGTFYGLGGDQNKFQPGETVLLQWGAYDDLSTPLNVSLSRWGGALVGDILEGALFSLGGSIYRTTNYSSSNCILDQYNWTIPLSFNTTDPQYLIGLFNASTVRGMDGNDLWGFMGWSPIFYVEPTTTTTTTTTTTAAGTTTTTTTTAAGTTTTTAAVAAGAATATAAKPDANNNPAATTTSSASSSPTSSSDSAGLSGGTKAGIGVGVALGVLALVGVFIFIFFRRRRAAGYTNTETQKSPVEIGGAWDVKAPKQPIQVHEMDGRGVSELQEHDRGHIPRYK